MGSNTCNEVDETSRVIRHVSALHDSYNGSNIYSDCCQENNIGKLTSGATSCPAISANDRTKEGPDVGQKIETRFDSTCPAG